MEIEIKQLLSLPEDELLFRLGKEIAGTSARGEPRNLLIKRAKDWLSNRSGDFREAICSNPAVRTSLTMPPSSERQVALVMAASDALSTILIGIPPFTISVLLVRVGLDSLCKDFNTNAPE